MIACKPSKTKCLAPTRAICQCACHSGGKCTGAGPLSDNKNRIPGDSDECDYCRGKGRYFIDGEPQVCFCQEE